MTVQNKLLAYNGIPVRSIGSRTTRICNVIKMPPSSMKSGNISKNPLIWTFYNSTAENSFSKSRISWSSMAEKDSETGRDHIRGVMGPDEFHTGYPDAAVPGLDDNAYTNIMAVWTLQHAKHLLKVLPEIPRRQLLEDLSIPQAVLDHWEDVSRRMYVPFHDHGIISQFAGYDRLQELDLEGYRQRYRDVRRIDRILEAEGDSVNRYKVSKQPDVLMLFYLLSLNDLKSIFSGLGYPFSLWMLRNTIAYYQQRTVHGSTLSRIVFGWILARSDRRGSWQCVIEALGNDAHHIKSGSTGQGIHLGAMAGTVDLIQRCYGDLSIENDMLWLDPQLPKSLRGLSMNIYYRHHQVHVQVSPDSLSIQMSPGSHFQITINVRGRPYTINSTQKQEFAL